MDENSIEFEFQTDRNKYTDSRQTYLSLVLKLVKHRVFDDEHYVKNIMHYIFSNVEVYINIQHVYN